VSCAQAKTVQRAVGVAQKKDGSSWYSCKDRTVSGSGFLEADRAAQCVTKEERNVAGSSSIVAKAAVWCSRMARQASSVARLRGVAPFL